MVLAECSPGTAVRLRGVRAEEHRRTRLAELGFYPGVNIRVLGRCVAGGLVLAVGDGRMAVDAETGRSLLVEPAH